MSFCLRPNVCKKCGKPLTIFEGWFCLECEKAEEEPQCTEHPCLGTLCRYYKEPCDDAISLTKEAYSDLCLRASKADDLQRALDMEKGAYNALVKNIQCDDAISREDALKCLNDTWGDYFILNEVYERIDKLPSVQPSRKGHWIEDDDECECPFCHKTWNYCDNNTEEFDHCPKCGALLVDMRGAE